MFELLRFRQTTLTDIMTTMLRVSIRTLLTVCGIASMVCLLFAQSTPAPNQGLWPFGTASGGQFDTVNVATLGIQVRATFRSKQGAPSLPFSFVAGASDYVSFGPGADGGPTGSFGAAGLLGMVGGSVQKTVSKGCYEVVNGLIVYYNYIHYTLFYVTDVFGNSHRFAITVNSICLSGGAGGSSTTPNLGSAYATDGSGYYLSVSCTTGCTRTLYDPSGRQLNAYGTFEDGGGNIEKDPDGNSEQYSFTFIGTTPPSYTFTDSLGQPAAAASLPSTTANTWNITWPNATTTGQSNASITYSPYYIGNGTGSVPCGHYSAENTGLYNVITGMTFGDGSLLSIGYEQGTGTNPNGGPCYTGRFSSLSLPTGGTISYAYTGATNVDGTPSTMTRTTPLDGQWTYVHAWVSPTSSTTAVTDPAANETDYTFAGFNETGSTYETLRKVYAGSAASGTLLETFQRCYDNNFSGCTTTVPVFPITQTDVFTSLNGGASNLVETKFDAHGNTTEVKRYDYVFATIAAPTVAPLSDTLTYYGQSWNGTSCTAYASGNIQNTPCYSVTKNSAGAPAAQTQISYSTTGHPISMSRWVSGTGVSAKYLPSSATYNNSNGTIMTATDANGAVSTYAYNGTDGCAGLLPTSVSVAWTFLPAGSLTTGSTQWDCNGGVATQTSDPNGQPTNYTYNDPLWRVTLTTDPLLNATNYSYPTPTTFDTTMSFPSSLNKVLTTDGLGRVIESQTRTAPGATTFDNTIVYGYGWNATGAVATQTIPGGTAVTTTQYDAIGRPLSATDAGGGKVSYTNFKNDVLQSVGPTQTFQNQLEYDGMGRLTSVCEITSASGSGAGACGQSNPQTGLLTKYAYDALGNLLTVTQNAQPGAVGGTQTRTYTYDGLSRLTSEINPESGKTQYFWDAAPPACYNNVGYPTPGDLGAKLDNAGVYTCYGYDGLHRLLGFDHSNGGQCSSFVYDSATPPSGVTVSNPKGHLINAYTNSACNGRTSLVADRWLGYSPRGEVTDIYSSTPNSKGYYHVTKGYRANGAVETLGGIPGVPTITYGVDGEGRTSTMAGGSQNLVTATSYNPASQVTGVTFGSGDSDLFQYDPNTGRMTQYTFKVNGQSVIGKQTWNPNSTLGQFQVTQDPFNPGNVQTCAYSYDDLDRIKGANCGSIWAQTFTYDPFGNITKSGSSSWMPNYASPSNNQYMTGWNGVSYDADGNLTNDTFHSYQWDPQGHMIANDSSTFTYDALGNMAEASWGDQYLCDENGALLAGSNAQTAAYFAPIALPEGRSPSTVAEA